MKKRILPMIMILEILMIFVFVVLKRNYIYNGYTFHLDNANLYSISSGESFVGEKITVMPGDLVEFRGNLYRVRMSGNQDDFTADIFVEESAEGNADTAGIASEKMTEAEVVRNFVWAVYANDSPMLVVWILLLDLAGWIFIKKPEFPFAVLYSWRVKEELHPSEAFLNITRVLGCAMYVLGIYLTYQYIW